jgi:hypothetical protein
VHRAAVAVEHDVGNAPRAQFFFQVGGKLFQRARKIRRGQRSPVGAVAAAEIDAMDRVPVGRQLAGQAAEKGRRPALEKKKRAFRCCSGQDCFSF